MGLGLAPGASCSTASAISTLRSSTGRRPCGASSRSSRAIASSRPCSAWRSTSTSSPTRLGPGSPTSTRRTATIARGAATTPTPTTRSRRSIRRRTYRISGTRGDSIYFSLTVYNEPSPGQWSNRVVGIVNDADLELRRRGSVLVHGRPDAARGLRRALHRADRRCGRGGRRATTSSIPIAVSGSSGRSRPIDPPDTYRYTDAGQRRGVPYGLALGAGDVRHRAADRGARADETTLGHNCAVGANTCAAPYQVPDANYGWSARDACYSFGSFSLRARRGARHHAPAAGSAGSGASRCGTRTWPATTPTTPERRSTTALRSERRRHRHDRHRPRTARTPELDVDDRPRRGRDRVSLVPSRSGTRHAGRRAGRRRRRAACRRVNSVCSSRYTLWTTRSRCVDTPSRLRARGERSAGGRAEPCIGSIDGAARRAWHVVLIVAGRRVRHRARAASTTTVATDVHREPRTRARRYRAASSSSASRPSRAGGARSPTNGRSTVTSSRPRSTTR